MAFRFVKRTILNNMNHKNPINHLFKYISENVVKLSANIQSESQMQPSGTFYHRFSHPQLSMDIQLVPKPTAVTSNCLNLYFPQTFCGPFNQSPMPMVKKIIEDFYRRHDLRNTNQRFVTLTDDLIVNGTLMDSLDPHSVAHNLIVMSCMFFVDDLFEQLISDSETNATFGIQIIKNFCKCLDNPGVKPPELYDCKVDDSIVAEARLLQHIWLDMVKEAQEMWSKEIFGAWQRALKHYLAYSIDFEPLIIRSNEHQPIAMNAYFLSRTVTIGLLLLTPYALNDRWDLDKNFIPDNYFTRMASLHLALLNDLISHPKEITRNDRQMSYIQVLIGTGMSNENALIAACNEANRVMDICYSMYEDYRFEHLRKFFYADMRSIASLTKLQFSLPRYGWIRMVE